MRMKSKPVHKRGSFAALINIVEERMKKMNAAWALILVLTAAGFMTGCSKKEAAGSGTVELSVAWWGGEGRHKKTLAMIDKYMAKFPDVKVVSQYAPYTDYFTKMATLAAGGNMPDVYLVQLSYVGEYASKGLMRPLQDLIDAGKIDVSKFTPGALSGSSYNGKVVGITLGDTAGCIVYNKTLLEKAGYPLPKDQMSYSEFSAYLKGLVPKLPKDTYAFILNYNNDAAPEIFARNHGYDGIISADGKSLGYTKEILAGFIGFYYDLFKAGVSGSMENVLEDRPKQFGDSLMGKGKMALWLTNVNQGKIFQASVDDELGMMRYPVADNYTNKNVEAAICSTWAISGKTAKVDAAAQFVSHMVNDWDLQEIYDMDIGVPGSTAVQEQLISKLDPGNKIDILKKREIELMQNILKTIEPFGGRPPSFGAVLNDLYLKIDAVFSGQMTVEQAVDAHFATAQTLLQ
jgi:multiple sugar transport system substrate-binding protein